MKRVFVRGKVLRRRCNRNSKGQEVAVGEGEFDWVKNGKNGLKGKGKGGKWDSVRVKGRENMGRKVTGKWV